MTDREDELGLLQDDSERSGSSAMDNLVIKASEVLEPRRLPTSTDESEFFALSLRSAVLSEDPAQLHTVLQAMRDAKIPVAQIIDHYIPDVARRLGVDWHENRRSFADVTIGTARLQGVLRELSELDSPIATEKTDAKRIVIVVLEGEYHTLGAMVLAQQIRRTGTPVQIIVGHSDDEVVSALCEEQVDTILISVSRVEALNDVKVLVHAIRNAMVHRVPVFVGGAVLEKEEKVLALTDADDVSLDANDVLQKCGLKISPNGANPRAKLE